MFSLPAILRVLLCACEAHHTELRLIFLQRRSESGNVLSPINRRKANFCYISFVEMEVLHLEHLWVLLSLQTCKPPNALQRCKEVFQPW